MGTFLLFIILVGAVWAYFKLKSPTYRISLIDPVTGYTKYLSSVDGINHSFTYSASPDAAITFKDPKRAEVFASQVDKVNQPTIKKKGFLNWEKQGII